MTSPCTQTPSLTVEVDEGTAHYLLLSKKELGMLGNNGSKSGVRRTFGDGRLDPGHQWVGSIQTRRIGGKSYSGSTRNSLK